MFGQQRQQSKGNDLRVQMHISFSEAFYGCTKVFNIDGRPITLGIRPGAKSNQKLILRGQGQAHPFNSQLPNGDIIVELSVELNSENIIDPQNNIWRDISMPWYDIMIGGKVSISTIDGAVSINIPKNTKPGKVLRLKERGWPDYNTGVRGNLMVKLIPTYPDLNDEQLEYIKKVQIK
jgi:curved DNA-binding protein